MKILLGIVVLLILVGAGLYLYANSLPAKTTHTRSIVVQQTPDAVFALLEDFENMPSWNRNMESIEILPPIHGKPATRQTFHRKMQMTIITTESDPPTHLVRSMGDDSGPFAGSWTYATTPTASGSSIVLVEQSEVKSPFFRLMMKLFSPTKYMDEHLEDIAKHFGETATVK